MIYPFVCLLAAWIFGFFAIAELAGVFTDWLLSFPGFHQLSEKIGISESNSGYLQTTIAVLMRLLLFFLFWLVGNTVIKYLLLFLLSPVFALLSEKTETYLTGQRFPFSWTVFLRDTFRGMVFSLRNLFMELLIMMVCGSLSLLFPPAAIITVPVALICGWYFTGQSLLAYNSERHGFTMKESISFSNNNRAYACGLGMVYSGFMILPFFPGMLIGFVLGPALTVIAGTIWFTKQKERLV